MAVALAACSSTAKLSSEALCENSGGRYAQETCQPGSARKAEGVCRGSGGVSFAQEELPRISALDPAGESSQHGA
jgi:hypothetical protein